MQEINRYYMTAFREASFAGRLAILVILVLMPALVIGSLIYLFAI